MLGPALARLSTTFPDRDAYREFWRGHPAFAGEWTEGIDAYTQRDLVGTEPELRSSCVLEAVQIDGAQVLLDEEAAGAVHRLPCPADLLWAERGLLDEPQGLYDRARLELARLDTERVPAAPVPGTNHYSILWGGAGADRIVRILLADALAAE